MLPTLTLAPMALGAFDLARVDLVRPGSPDELRRLRALGARRVATHGALAIYALVHGGRVFRVLVVCSGTSLRQQEAA
jgi:hypothetical protein